MKFCTWHDSGTVIACALFCTDMMCCNGVTLIPIFHGISIMMEKSFVKWATCPIYRETTHHTVLPLSGPGPCSNINTLRPRQDGRLFAAEDIFKCIFFNENVLILIKISLKFVPKVWINNISALFQIIAWCQPGDKPLSGPVMVSSLTHICVTRPQWVKAIYQCITFLIIKMRWPHNCVIFVMVISILVRLQLCIGMARIFFLIVMKRK